jgi:hypothetical protein
LDFIDAVPVAHRELFRASFEQYEKRPITDEDERKYREMSCCRFNGHQVKLIPACARTQQG